MDFDLSCIVTLNSVDALLDTRSSDPGSSVEQLEAAFWHLRRCSDCRNALTAPEHVRFVREVALVRG
jgi:hypothetical protein